MRRQSFFLFVSPEEADDLADVELLQGLVLHGDAAKVGGQVDAYKARLQVLLILQSSLLSSRPVTEKFESSGHIVTLATRSVVRSETPSSALEMMSRLKRTSSSVLLVSSRILSTLLMMSLEVSSESRVMLLAI